MGEVYRALDTRLQREVAIKVLPQEVAADPDRIARFEREARATAALNHPNILSVYDVGSTGGTTYVVSELLSGESLRGRLQQGPVPVRKCIDIARQIAAGLAAAHERGVAHRDLKPENVFLTADGHVKILDFGLAKLLDDRDAPAVVTMDTMTSPRTAAGMILGTPGYMAPEQVRGSAVDHRADIFAFGAILYEMLSGARAFRGASTADTIAAILNSDPPELRRADGIVPAALDVLTRRCLEKDPRDRFQSARDAGFALEAVASQSSDAPSPGRWARPTRRRRVLLMVGSAVILAFASAAVAWRMARMGGSAAAPTVLSVLAPPGVEIVGPPAVSPAGGQIAFAGVDPRGSSRLYVRAFDTREAKPIPRTEGAEQPFWSPDGQSVAYFAGGKLWRTELAGGVPLALADVASARGGTWGPDGTIVFAPNPDDGLYRVPAGGGTVARVTTLDRQKGEISHRWPRFVAGTRYVLFMNRIAEKGPTRYIVTAASLDGGTTKQLLEANSTAVYIDGSLLFLRATTLFAQPFDPANLRLSGEPVTVVDRVWGDAPSVAGLVGFDAAAGIIAARPIDDRSLRLAWMDREGKTSESPSTEDVGDFALSPDGTRLAVSTISRLGVENGTEVFDLLRGTSTPLSPPGIATASPLWSPDGSRVVYSPVRGGAFDLYVKGLAPGTPETLLLHTDGMKAARSWSPDGRYILFNAIDPKTRVDLWLLDLQRPGSPTVFIGGEADQGDGRFSPDGHWVAYVSTETGRAEVYVRPFAANGSPVQMSVEGGDSPEWNPDGKELFYVAPDNRLMTVPIRAANGRMDPEAPVPLFHLPVSQSHAASLDVAPDRVYAVAPGGKRFLVKLLQGESKVGVIDLLLNWSPVGR
jgi:Tol biopolymer transport system component